MNTKPEALRLAETLDVDATNGDMGRKPDQKCHKRQAAAELRRLHNEVTDLKQALEIADAVFKERDKLDSVNAELLEALKLADLTLSDANMNRSLVEKKVRAAIAKATGEKP
jgi:tyrosyl-tRNA synthetase